MTSQENLTTVEPWAFCSTFADSWISDEIFLSETISSFLDHTKPEIATTPTVSGVSAGSDPERASKRRRTTISAATGRVSKIKSRASKRTQTTFITADAANFRQMVQQMTGVRLGNLQASLAPILNPEPQRLGRRMTGGGFLPKLDTSAVLLDHPGGQMMGSNVARSGVSSASSLSYGGGAGISGGGSAAVDLERFCSYPTLESWKVV